MDEISSPQARAEDTATEEPRGFGDVSTDEVSKGNMAHLPFLPNTHDYLVIQQLRTTPVGELAVDRLVRDARQVPAFRDALASVYFKAAKARESSKATKGQLQQAKSALSRLTLTLENLAKVNTDGRDGLRILLEGSRLADENGDREPNELASACWKTRMDVAKAGLALQSAIETEAKKPTKTGERRKRLRTLVEALADSWQSTGGSLASTVVANRRDFGQPAVVHGRRGCFLTLAVTLFCNVDVFEESEVEAAVTNVYENRLTPTKSRTKD